MKLFKQKRLASSLVFAGIFALMGSGFTQAQQAGTTLSTTKTATGFWERLIEYDWTVLKEVSPSSITLGTGESADVTYKISTTKTAKLPADTYGSTGQICVTNGGGEPTENLVIVDNIQAKIGKGQFATISSTNVDTSSHPIIAAGETWCYDYRATFSPLTGATYRNEAKVTITNHSGYLPGGQNCPGPDLCAFGPQYRVGFTLPSSYTTVYKDASATITDTFTSLSGFSVSVTDAGPWTRNAAGVITFTATITNNSALCSSTYALINTAELVESDTKQTSSDSESLGIGTKDCTNQVLFKGCTYTQGYWKNHYPGAWPASVVSDGLMLGNVKYTADQLMSIFNEVVNGNGLISLAHQLIAAKLNTLKESDPASGGPDYNAITLADAMIGDLVVPPVGSDYLSTSTVSGLVGMLDEFNNGGLLDGYKGTGDYDGDGTQDGPPHCN